MAPITDGYTIFALTHLAGYSGISSGTEGAQDLIGFFGGPYSSSIKSITYTGMPAGSEGGQDLITFFGEIYATTIRVARVNSTALLTTGFHTYYKMEGFNPTTNAYENWHSMDIPLMTPPSGNALTNIGVATSWIDR